MKLLQYVLLISLFIFNAKAYTTSGNKILDPSGNPVLLRGFARPSLEWNPYGEHLSLSDYQLMKSKGANVVRVAMNQCFWLSGHAGYSSTYAATIAQQVAWVKSLGMGMILDLHWSDQGNMQNSQCGQQNMADVNSLTFWTQVATIYKNDPWVIFELYNEPKDVSWSTWLNGGYDSGYRTVGMQNIYDTIRATGANNAVIVGGLDWAFDLSGVANYPVVGNNIIYNTHPYDYSSKQISAWPAAFGFLSNKYPLIATEFGDYNCNPTYNTLFVNYANQLSISWTAWAWYVAGCAFPSAISDWSGTPSVSGTPVMNDLKCTNKVPGATINLCSGATVTPTTSAPVTLPPVTLPPVTLPPVTLPPISTKAPPAIGATTTPTTTASSLKIQVHTGATVWWYAILVVNGDSATSVDLKDSGAITTYTPFAQTNWGYYIFPSQPSPLQAPFYIRVTSSTGVLVYVTIPSLLPSAVIDSGVSLSGGGSVATPAATVAATVAATIAATVRPTSPPVTTPPVTTSAPTLPPVTLPPVTLPPVTTPPVTNPPVTTPPVTNSPATSSAGTLKIQVNSGASAYWFAVAVVNGNSATKVELKDAGAVGSYTAFSPTNWGYWIFSASSSLQAPISIRVTSSSGNSVVVEAFSISPGALIDSGRSL